MGITSIEWTDRSVNPIRARLNGAVGHHCEKVSPGCANCYASRMQPRFGLPPYQADKRAGVEPFFDAARLEEVLRRRTPTKWFWCDMTDLFGSWVPDEWIDQCFAVMALTPQHTHQILTKRPERMRAYIEGDGLVGGISGRSWRIREAGHAMGVRIREHVNFALPLRRVWLGVSVENQATADERIPLLLKTPSAVRFISAEPLLGPIDLEQVPIPAPGADHYRLRGVAQPMSERESEPDDWKYWTRLSAKLDWVIVGGESGPGARECRPAWVRSIVQQCDKAAVAAFVKQLGAEVITRNDDGFEGPTGCEGELGKEWPEHIAIEDRVEDNPHGYREEYQGADVRIHLRDRKGGDPEEWPLNLRVRELPETRD